MSQGARVREVRKALGLTLEKFGGKLGIQKSAISKIERGDTNLTDANARAICREYGVNYSWLTNGEGEMFVDNDEEFYKQIDRIMAGEDEVRRNIFKALADASDEDIAALWRIINRIADYCSADIPDSTPSPPATPTLDIDAEVEKYRQELELEKSQAARSSRSDAPGAEKDKPAAG